MPESLPPDPDWQPVAEAAAAARVPHRTVYRWADSKKLTKRSEGGVTLVSVSAVLALAERRKPGNAAPAGVIAGNRAGNGGAAGNVAKRPLEDGELAAQVFESFERGEKPAEVVQQLRVSPGFALQTWKQWQELREVGGKGGASIADRVSKLDQRTADLEARVAEVLAFLGEVHVLRGDLDAIASTVSQLPLPQPSHVCNSCGQGARLKVRVQCAACGGETIW